MQPLIYSIGQLLRGFYLQKSNFIVPNYVGPAGRSALDMAGLSLIFSPFIYSFYFISWY